MSAVSQEGMLVVFPSPLENVPYTLAEVAVAGTPLLTFDVGGASELIDPKTHEDLFCGLPSVRTPQHPFFVPRHHVIHCRQTVLDRRRIGFRKHGSWLCLEQPSVWGCASAYGTCIRWLSLPVLQYNTESDVDPV